jgi:hypothetical protein
MTSIPDNFDFAMFSFDMINFLKIKERNFVSGLNNQIV